MLRGSVSTASIGGDPYAPLPDSAPWKESSPNAPQRIGHAQMASRPSPPLSSEAVGASQMGNKLQQLRGGSNTMHLSTSPIPSLNMSTSEAPIPQSSLPLPSFLSSPLMDSSLSSDMGMSGKLSLSEDHDVARTMSPASSLTNNNAAITSQPPPGVGNSNLRTSMSLPTTRMPSAEDLRLRNLGGAVGSGNTNSLTMPPGLTRSSSSTSTVSHQGSTVSSYNPAGGVGGLAGIQTGVTQGGSPRVEASEAYPNHHQHHQQPHQLSLSATMSLPSAAEGSGTRAGPSNAPSAIPSRSASMSMTSLDSATKGSDYSAFSQADYFNDPYYGGAPTATNDYQSQLQVSADYPSASLTAHGQNSSAFASANSGRFGTPTSGSSQQSASNIQSGNTQSDRFTNNFSGVSAGVSNRPDDQGSIDTLANTFQDFMSIDSSSGGSIRPSTKSQSSWPANTDWPTSQSETAPPLPGSDLPFRTASAGPQVSSFANYGDEAYGDYRPRAGSNGGNLREARRNSIFGPPQSSATSVPLSNPSTTTVTGTSSPAPGQQFGNTTGMATQQMIQHQQQSQAQQHQAIQAPNQGSTQNAPGIDQSQNAYYQPINASDMATTSQSADSRPCRFYQEGHCARGDRCMYTHVVPPGPIPGAGLTPLSTASMIPTLPQTQGADMYGMAAMAVATSYPNATSATIPGIGYNTTSAGIGFVGMNAAQLNPMGTLGYGMNALGYGMPATSHMGGNGGNGGNRSGSYGMTRSSSNMYSSPAISTAMGVPSLPFGPLNPIPLGPGMGGGGGRRNRHDRHHFSHHSQHQHHNDYHSHMMQMQFGPGAKSNNDLEARFHGVQLEDVTGQLTALAKDQHGCRFLQRKLEEGGSVAATQILDEVLPRFGELMTDPFGNYLCQKLLDYISDNQKTAILERTAPELVTVSLNMHGTRAVQKLVEHVSTAAQVQILVYALARHTVTLVKDLNGNHVIQKCLVRLAPADAQFIFDSVTAHCVEVATHRHGCCVLQRCLDYASPDARRRLAAEVTGHCLLLVKDPFGNYVVQYVLDMSDIGFIDAIASRLRGHVALLSMQKFASNVVEKCLRVASPEMRRALIAEIYARDVMERLLRDAYANYVVQTSIDYADVAQRALLIDCLSPLIPLIRNTPYGKRIMSKLNLIA